MPASSCVIIYYQQSKLMRGVIYPDFDSEINAESDWATKGLFTIRDIKIDESGNVTRTETPGYMLRPGEHAIVAKYYDIQEHPTLPKHHAENCRIHLASKIGPPAHHGRCVLVPKSTTPTPENPHIIQQAIMADPDVDMLPDHHLHLHAEAGPGWIFDGRDFKPPNLGG